MSDKVVIEDRYCEICGNTISRRSKGGALHGNAYYSKARYCSYSCRALSYPKNQNKTIDEYKLAKMNESGIVTPESGKVSFTRKEDFNTYCNILVNAGYRFYNRKDDKIPTVPESNFYAIEYMKEEGQKMFFVTTIKQVYKYYRGAGR